MIDGISECLSLRVIPLPPLGTLYGYSRSSLIPQSSLDSGIQVLIDDTESMQGMTAHMTVQSLVRFIPLRWAGVRQVLNQPLAVHDDTSLGV